MGRGVVRQVFEELLHSASGGGVDRPVLDGGAVVGAGNGEEMGDGTEVHKVEG